MDFIRELTDEDKEGLVQMVVDLYSNNPSRLRTALPEAADLLDDLASVAARDLASSPFGLKYRERNFRPASLQAVLDRAADGEALTKEEAVETLEAAAVLGYDGWHLRHAVLDVARAAFDFTLVPEESRSIQILKGEQVHHTYSLIRGITLSLTWDGKLVKIDLDTKELKYRHQALSIIGIGRDKDNATDVAENHDAYLEEIYGE